MKKPYMPDLLPPSLEPMDLIDILKKETEARVKDANNIKRSTIDALFIKQMINVKYIVDSTSISYTTARTYINKL